ncbi:MAG TPA: hypothetical protein DCE03_05985 [Synergistaceae bacterium]|jgi:hypothetical protein|nr:MAG: hypothetical protein XD80_0044 [Synergistales bacterium 53_16]KUL04958.1 MAG: hypothetical protein XE12_0214 [Synergistales bacterium 54_9]MDN5335552.1 hypothetical protein [Synergistales bacterium]HAA48017.1 hypothetical protein [Synergistaceae bacterium]HAG22108.1 hypothetical protein [Synergistaceae bacterium]
MSKGIRFVLKNCIFPNLIAFLSVVLITAVVFLGQKASAAAVSTQPGEVWTTHPWLSMTARFIGGAYSSVRGVQGWTEEGELRRLGLPPQGTVILAFDPTDAKMAGVEGKGLNLILLYERDLGGVGGLEMPFLDPATLPFVALRTMSKFSQLDPENYSYYQRRLAEFQARLDSTVLVGRQLLGSLKILDLCWEVGRWMQAATGMTVSPPAEVKNSWAKGNDMETLILAVKEAQKQGWLILCDAWTPPGVAEVAMKYGNYMILPVPSQDQDFFLYLYDLYLMVWNSVRLKGAEEGRASR